MSFTNIGQTEFEFRFLLNFFGTEFRFGKKFEFNIPTRHFTHITPRQRRIGRPYSEGIIKSRDTTGISDLKYREYRDITQERIVYHDIF